jgi:hypothetical protein
MILHRTTSWKFKSAGRQGSSAEKPTTLSPDDLEIIMGIYHLKVCAFHQSSICDTWCHLSIEMLCCLFRNEPISSASAVSMQVLRADLIGTWHAKGYIHSLRLLWVHSMCHYREVPGEVHRSLRNMRGQRKRGIVSTSQETHHVTATKPNRLMLFGETVAVYCENHMEHTDTLCGQNAEFLPHKKHITSPLQSPTG